MFDKRDTARQKGLNILTLLVLGTAGAAFILILAESDPFNRAIGYGFAWGLLAANTAYQRWRGPQRALILVMAGISAVVNAPFVLAWLGAHALGWLMVSTFAGRLARMRDA